MHNSARLRCFENGNDDFGVEAFWIEDATRVGYFVPLNGPINGHPPSIDNCGDNLWNARSLKITTTHVSDMASSFAVYHDCLLDRCGIGANYTSCTVRHSFQQKV